MPSRYRIISSFANPPPRRELCRRASGPTQEPPHDFILNELKLQIVNLKSNIDALPYSGS